MLVLTRKLGEQLQIGDNVIVTISSINGNTVRIAVEAPRETRILRGELVGGARETTSGYPARELVV